MSISETIHNIAEKLHLVSPSGGSSNTYGMSEADRDLANRDPKGPIYQLLNRIPLRDVVPKNQDLVIAFEELNACSIINVCHLYLLFLNQYTAPHHINVVPICDKNGKLTSALTMLDFMAWIANFDDNKTLSPGERWAKREEMMKDRTVAGMRLRDGTIADVLKFANPPEPRVLNLDDPASEAAKLFATGVKFVLFVDHAMAPKNILTQHDIASYIYSCLLTNATCKV